MGNLLGNCNNDLSLVSLSFTLFKSLFLCSIPLEGLLALHLFSHESDIQSQHLIGPLDLWNSLLGEILALGSFYLHVEFEMCLDLKSWSLYSCLF